MSSALVWQLIRDGSTNTAVRRNHSHLDRASLCGHFGTKGNVLSWYVHHPHTLSHAGTHSSLSRRAPSAAAALALLFALPVAQV